MPCSPSAALLTLRLLCCAFSALSAVCAEWFYGGQPLWLHDSGFAFREYNPGWLEYMENMMTTVVQHVEPYLARNGGSAAGHSAEQAERPSAAAQLRAPLPVPCCSARS